MSKLAIKLQRFWSELRRRKTVRTAIAYLILIAAVVGPASDILDGLGAPSWILQFLIIGLFIGFPIALVLSWVFDFTWHGIERTQELKDSDGGEERLAAELETETALELNSDQPSISIETGSAHRHQISLLRTSVVLAQGESVVNEPERMLHYVSKIELIVNALAEKYSARLLRHDGTSFSFLFGYPGAYENDAIRAVVMGLAIEQDIKQFSKNELAGSALRLTAVSGIHSDVVVIDQDTDNPDKITVVGSALQETQWVQSLAGPGSVMLDSFSYKLLRNRVHCDSIGAHRNNHSGETTPLYKALELRSSQLDHDIYREFHDVFLGRNSEVELILDRWQRAKEGEDEFVILRGEPGIGKSTIIKEVTKRILDEEGNDALLMPLFCSPLEKNSAFQPIIEYLMGPGLGLHRSDSAAERTQRIQQVLGELKIDVERAVPLVASLLSFDDADDNSFSEIARTELITYLLEMVRATAKLRRLIFVIEDLHWADPSTLEVINLMLSDAPETGMLCLFTTRPTLHLPWESRSSVTTLDLQKLSRRSTRELVDNFLHDLDLPEKFLQELVQEAGGNPLFAEELAKSIFETAQSNPDYKKAGLVLPSTLQRSLASRMDNMGTAKPLLQLCSLLGREFEFDLLLAVSGANDVESLKKELNTLVNAEFLYQTGTPPKSSYTFKHILMQETAYQSMLNATRKELHARIARELETQPESLDSIPELLAYHYEGSEDFAKAALSWIAAANRSLASFSSAEAAELAANGINQIDNLPESTERDMLEIQLRGIRGRALLTSAGYADPGVEQSFNRALELCDKVGDVPQLFVFLVGLWSYFQIAGSVSSAENVAERLMRLAENDESNAKKVQALYCAGYTAYRGGRFEAALECLVEAQELAAAHNEDYTEFAPSGDDGRIHNFAVASHILWQLGEMDEALEQSETAVELAAQLENPVGSVFAIFMRTWLFNLDRSFPEAIECADKSVALAKANGLKFWIANSLFIKTLALYHLDREEKGEGKPEDLDKLLGFVDKAKFAGARFGTVEMFLQTAEALAFGNRLEEAQDLLDETTTLFEKTGERYLHSELYRVRGEILRRRGKSDLALDQLREAVRIAEKMSAATLLMRAAIRLADLYQELGRTQDAEEVRALVDNTINGTGGG